MTFVGTIHTGFGFAALGFGTINVLRPKGTPSHRLIGHLYYLAMLGLNGTALAIYEVFGTFGVFHWLAVLSLTTTIAAIVPVLLRRPRRTWRIWHAQFMSYSYVGLTAAAAAEVGVRLPVLIESDHPNLYFAAAAGLPTLLVTVIGIVVVRRTLRPLMSPVGEGVRT
jgi:uncharacterized membrane protein